MQETNFAFEIIINDDASTDGTTEIIKEYEDKYPEIIVPVYHKENQYSKGIRGINIRNTFPISRGKYLALCDGDDYWTDPLKLQKQVDFLEKNEDYILTCGGYNSCYSGEIKTIIEKGIVNKEIESEKGFTFLLSDTTNTWITKTLTAVFRNRKDIINELKKYKYTKDLHLFYQLLKNGKGYYFKEVFGVYNMHEGGIFSLKSDIDKTVSHYYIFKELLAINHDEYSRQWYLMICSKIINYKLLSQLRDKRLNTFTLLKESILLIKNKADLLTFIKPFIPRSIKHLWHKS